MSEEPLPQLPPALDPESQAIADMERIRNFLNDDAVKRALAALNRKYFDEFKASKSPEDRESAWAKARAIEDFGNELEAILAVGKVAKHHREQQEQREEMDRKLKAARQRR